MTPLTLCKNCGGTSKFVYKTLQDRVGNAKGSWSLIGCNNSKCGLAWIDPIPYCSTLSSAYETYYTHTENRYQSRLRCFYLQFRNNYIRRRFGYPITEISWWIRAMGTLMAILPHRRIGMEAMVMWVPWHPGGKLLEIGCGNGDRLALFRDLGWKVKGIEPDTKVASIKGLDIVAGTLESGKFQGESFDVIVLSHVIEHVFDPLETIRECHRLLRPGGRLAMLTPNTESLGHRWFGRNWLHLDAPRHLHLFNSHNLAKLCMNIGLTDVRSTTTARDANWTLGASRELRNGKRYTIGQLPFAAKMLGLLLFYVEWLALFIKPQCGEEVLVIASRRND